MPQLDSWNPDIHETLDQIKRLLNSHKIKNDQIEFDILNQKAIVYGSGFSPYEVTLTECTCFDFLSRNLPCKHIYRLAAELNCCPELINLNRKAAKQFKDIIPDEVKRFYMLYKEGAISADKFVKIANAIQSGK